EWSGGRDRRPGRHTTHDPDGHDTMDLDVEPRGGANRAVGDVAGHWAPRRYRGRWETRRGRGHRGTVAGLGTGDPRGIPSARVAGRGADRGHARARHDPRPAAHAGRTAAGR